MQVLNTIPLVDGGAVIEIVLSLQELHSLGAVGVVSVLKEAIKTQEVIDAQYCEPT